MTSNQCVAIGVRLFAIWLVVDVIEGAPGAYAFLAQGGSPAPAGIVALIVATSAVLVLIAILLWRFPLVTARQLLPRTAQEQSIAVPAAESIERAGFCLLGLWLLVRTLPELVFDGVRLHLHFAPGSTLALRPDDYAGMAAHGVELVLAIWLLLGAKGLLGVIRRARTVGSNPVVERPDEE